MTDAQVAPKSRAGRNLPAAIGVGVFLVALLGASLAFRPEPFLLILLAAIGLGLYELHTALRLQQLDLPLAPLLVGMVGIVAATHFGGRGGQVASIALALVAVVGWLVVDGPTKRSLRNVSAATFGVVYLPLLASFVVLMLQQPNGNWRIAFFLLLPIANDTGGYIAGVLFGKHPLAPRISPKKSWEGLAGSAALTIIVGILGSLWVLQLPLWPNALLVGVAIGIAAAITSTFGDLAESLLKRDLGVKDMSSLLPGHGGILDRLDSILLTAPFMYLIFLVAA